MKPKSHRKYYTSGSPHEGCSVVVVQQQGHSGYHLRLTFVAGFRVDMENICLKLEESFQQDVLLIVHDESW